MSDLNILRKWFSIGEAAEYLNVSETELILASLDGAISLTVRFNPGAYLVPVAGGDVVYANGDYDLPQEETQGLVRLLNAYGHGESDIPFHPSVVHGEGGAIYFVRDCDKTICELGIRKVCVDKISSLIQKNHTSSYNHENSTSGWHISKKLSTLNRAAQKFWANADPSDKNTQPTNAKVEEWLHENGYTKSLAAYAASIIRPEWASSGRKPNE